jgi:hypothetical protein
MSPPSYHLPHAPPWRSSTTTAYRTLVSDLKRWHGRQHQRKEQRGRGGGVCASTYRPLQDAILGSFKTAIKEQNTKAACPIVLERMNATITRCVTEISIEFADKKSVGEKIAAKWRAMRELEEKATTDVDDATWQAY